MKISGSLPFIALVFALSGCGNNPAPETAPSKGCASGSAELAVYDNDSAVLCGCQETSGRVAANDTLKCTVSKDTVVFIHFFGVQNTHSLAPTGSPVFPSSPNIDPTSSAPVREHALKLSETGTYGFTDLYNSSIHGEIIVQ